MRLLEAKTFWKEIGDRSRMPALRALKIDHRFRAEFVDHLAAGAARRAWHILFANYRNFSDFHGRAELRNGGKNGGALGAIRHSVRGIFHVAARKYLAACGA